MSKQCSICKETKELNRFYYAVKQKWYSSYCKPCHRAYTINNRKSKGFVKINTPIAELPAETLDLIYNLKALGVPCKTIAKRLDITNGRLWRFLNLNPTR